MSIVDLDERGRLTLPSEIRKKTNLKRKALIINAGDHIKIISIPEDPFTTLKGTISIETPFKKLREKATTQITQEATKNTPP